MRMHSAKTKSLVEDGRLGTIRAIVYRWHNPRPASMPLTWRDQAELSSAGSIADVGSHAYFLIRWILGEEATQVLTHADTITPAKPDLGAIDLSEALQHGMDADAPADVSRRKGGTFDYASIAFKMAAGAVGTLVLSHATYLRKALAPELELHGELGSLAVDRVSGDIRFANPDGSVECIDTLPDQGFGNRFAKYVFPALRRFLEGEPSDHPDLLDGYRVQLFTDAAARSAREGAWVGVGEDHE